MTAMLVAFSSNCLFSANIKLFNVVRQEKGGNNLKNFYAYWQEQTGMSKQACRVYIQAENCPSDLTGQEGRKRQADASNCEQELENGHDGSKENEGEGGLWTFWKRALEWKEGRHGRSEGRQQMTFMAELCNMGGGWNFKTTWAVSS